MLTTLHKKNYIEQQNIEMAFSELKKAQAGNSKLTGKALLSLGQIYLELGVRPSKSFDYYEKCFCLDGADAEARAGMSLASIRASGQYTESEKILNRGFKYQSRFSSR